MGQYFDNDVTIKSKDIDVKFSILDKKFSLKSDNGVFSKDRLDRGSEVFIKTLLSLNLGQEVLDLGCGIGVVGLSLAHFNHANYTYLISHSAPAASSAFLCSSASVVEMCSLTAHGAVSTNFLASIKPKPVIA